MKNLLSQLVTKTRPSHARFDGHVIHGGLKTPHYERHAIPMHITKPTAALHHIGTKPVKMKQPKRKERYMGTLT